jgi:hypothetical protein
VFSSKSSNIIKNTNDIICVIDIEMPSSQFKFVLSNTTVGTLDEPSSRVIGRALGYTQVMLIDNSIL